MAPSQFDPITMKKVSLSLARSKFQKLLFPLLLAAGASSTALAAQDYGYFGEGQGHTGATSVVGPLTGEVAWRFIDSPGSGQPWIEDGRVFYTSISTPIRVIALDLEMGSMLWESTPPLGGGTRSLIGVNDGVVYTANGVLITALDAATGTVLWTSFQQVSTNLLGAIGFTPTGHPIIGGSDRVVSLDKNTGDFRWASSGAGSMSFGAQTGVNVVGDTCFSFADFGAGSFLVAMDAETGAFQDTVGPSDFFEGNTVVVGPDGVVYFHRGTSLSAYAPVGNDYDRIWGAQVQPIFPNRVAIDRDGFLYTLNSEMRMARLDPATGEELAAATPPIPITSDIIDYGTRSTLIDGAGYVYHYSSLANLANRLIVLTPSLDRVPFQNQALLNDRGPGGIALGGDGYLVVSDRLSITAYRDSTPGAAFCSPGVANSSGLPGEISARGSDLRADGNLVLRASQLPKNAAGLFINSQLQAFVPGAGGSMGTLCLGGSVGRFGQSIRNTGERGSFELRVDLSAQPQPTGTVSVMVGQTWSYQAWHRDVVAGSVTSNFTNGVSLTFQ